jgi:hypothetical protein
MRERYELRQSLLDVCELGVESRAGCHCGTLAHQ